MRRIIIYICIFFILANCSNKTTYSGKILTNDELEQLNFTNKGDIEKLNDTKMSNSITVKENLINLIAKIYRKSATPNYMVDALPINIPFYLISLKSISYR